MSSNNGDRSRFHRVRKQKIARRMRDREMIKGLETQTKAPSVTPSAKPKASIA